MFEFAVFSPIFLMSTYLLYSERKETVETIVSLHAI